uniref:Putative methyltransferase n=1 Tax=viral metagenome TaxID=1070528 RepID=A0A6M3L170_9ZZZZ
MKPQLTILIPTYQNFQVLTSCLLSLIKHTEYPYKVVVLNNDASPAGRETLEQLRQTDFEHLYLHHMASNAGWMGAINKGMDFVDTPFVCMCNDDVIFIPGDKAFWRKLVRHLGGRVAAVGPSSNFVAGWQSLFQINTPPALPVKYLIGFCMVLRTEIFRDFPLDETLPGGDDFDLSMRLRQAGWELIAEKDAYLHHIGSLTGNKLYGNYWNSMEQQDQTNNALIRKHGLDLWYDTVTLEPFDRKTADADLQAALSEEDAWVAEKLQREGKGANIGCGHNYLEGLVNIDRVATGEKGTGGRKFEGAKVDLQADACEIPLPDNSFDFILARHLFEHLIDPVQALREWTRLLKPYGRLFITCPLHSADDNTILIDFEHVGAYTPEALSNLLGVMNFRVKEAKAFAIGSFGVEAFIGEKGL